MIHAEWDTPGDRANKHFLPLPLSRPVAGTQSRARTRARVQCSSAEPRRR